MLHFASPASPADYLAHPIPTLKVGSLGTHNALGLAKAKDARFLLASTSEVYGDPEVHPQREDYWGNVNPIGPRGCYDEAKRFAEAITMAYHRYHGVKTRIVRIFNTYGPRMRLNDGRVLPAFMGQVLRGEPLTVYGEGDQTRSFCYVTDLVEGIYRLLQADFAEPVNIGNPSEITVLELAREILAMVAGHPGAHRLPRPPPGRPQAPPPRHHPRPATARLGPHDRPRRRPQADAGLLPDRALTTHDDLQGYTGSVEVDTGGGNPLRPGGRPARRHHLPGRVAEARKAFQDSVDDYLASRRARRAPVKPALTPSLIEEACTRRSRPIPYSPDPRQDFHRGVAAVDGDDAAAGVGAGAAEEEAGHGGPGFEAAVPHECREALALEDVPAGQADLALDVGGAEDLGVDDRLGHVVAVAGDRGQRQPPTSSRRESQSPSAKVCGTYWAKTLIVCTPSGATLGSCAVWK